MADSLPTHYETHSYDEARERYSLPDLPRPPDDEVRVFREPAEVAGDLSLTGKGAKPFRGAWVFLGGLRVEGSLSAAPGSGGPVLGVKGALELVRARLGGASVRAWGALDVETVLLAEEHSQLQVDGLTTAALVLTLGADVRFLGGFEGTHLANATEAHAQLVSACRDGAQIDADKLWNLAGEDRPLLIAHEDAFGAVEDALDEADDTLALLGAEAPVDEAYQTAQRLLQHWVRSEAVTFRPGTSFDRFAEKLVRALERVQSYPDPAGALSDWLLERKEVEDIFVDDAELVALPEE